MRKSEKKVVSLHAKKQLSFIAKTMKVTIIRKRGKQETITRHPIEDIALFILKGWRQHTVTELREMYNLILKERQPDGRILWVACPHDFWLPIPNTCLSELSVLALQVRWPS